MKQVANGFLFGVLIGALMRAPALTTFLPAYAITVSVMATLWLGLLLAPSNGQRGGFWAELFIATTTYILVAATMQIIPDFILLAMALQIVWSLSHWLYGSGAPVQAWYPPFATGANSGLLAVFIIFWWLL